MVDATKVHAALAAGLQVTAAKLRLEPVEGTDAWLLFMPDHRFPLAKATLRGDALFVEAENGHPIEGEEGLFHHDARDAWLTEEIAAHEAAKAKGADHTHPAAVALRTKRGQALGKLVGRIRIPLSA